SRRGRAHAAARCAGSGSPSRVRAAARRPALPRDAAARRRDARRAPPPRGGPLPASGAPRYFAVLASAVHALHAAGMVHRDVKPENVILVDDSPVLLHFGIARDIDDGTN